MEVKGLRLSLMCHSTCPVGVCIYSQVCARYVFDLLAPSLLQYRKRYVSIIFKEETTYIVVKFEM